LKGKGHDTVVWSGMQIDKLRRGHLFWYFVLLNGTFFWFLLKANRYQCLTQKCTLISKEEKKTGKNQVQEVGRIGIEEVSQAAWLTLSALLLFLFLAAAERSTSASLYSCMIQLVLTPLGGLPA
jgi:hypothetical protein